MRTRICWAPNCIFCVRSCHLEAMIEEQALLLRDRMTKVAVAAQCRAPLGCFEPGSSVGWLFDVFLTSLHHPSPCYDLLSTRLSFFWLSLPRLTRPPSAQRWQLGFQRTTC